MGRIHETIRVVDGAPGVQRFFRDVCAGVRTSPGSAFLSGDQARFGPRHEVFGRARFHDAQRRWTRRRKLVWAGRAAAGRGTGERLLAGTEPQRWRYVPALWVGFGNASGWKHAARVLAGVLWEDSPRDAVDGRTITLYRRGLPGLRLQLRDPGGASGAAASRVSTTDASKLKRLPGYWL